MSISLSRENHPDPNSPKTPTFFQRIHRHSHERLHIHSGAVSFAFFCEQRQHVVFYPYPDVKHVLGAAVALVDFTVRIRRIPVCFCIKGIHVPLGVPRHVARVCFYLQGDCI
ncbi:MAG: hypothetical protein LBS09_01705 [Bacteroidales bacterium]|nr:hypothetical protein [Bacteroidales bacterium]